MTSQEWKSYYEHNARSLLDVPWERGAELSADEIAAIGSSRQAFQAGENSEGHHLFKYAKAYVARNGDDAYVAAIRLFIAEEQRHARDLGRFLQLNKIPLLKTTFTDFVFRRLRHVLHGLEISIAVLVTAEIIAKAYYPLLQTATKSEILRRLCDQIIRDEYQHVEFQVQQLNALRSGRGAVGMFFTIFAQRFLFFGTTIVVWLAHRQALARGGLSARDWWRRCWEEFNGSFASPAQVKLEHATGHT